MKKLTTAIALAISTNCAIAETNKSFNPDISLILDGRYAHFQNNPEDYELPGFELGGEAGLGEDGFSLGHSELALSGNIDDKFYGFLTAALHSHDGETHLELEEAYIETLGLGAGLSVKAGRFFSAIGYLNEQHEHEWDFADAPLIYQGLFGNHLSDDGVQVSWIAPTDLFIQAGAEVSHDDAYTLFANIGGDIGDSHSWQIGISHWSSNIDARTSAAHSHAHEEEEDHEEEVVHTPSFSGDSQINAIDIVWKWAPNGNYKDRNFKLQFEYFDRQEDGAFEILGSDPLTTVNYDGSQSGWYLQSVYQFMPQWRVGLRYDRLDSDNQASNPNLLANVGLDNEGITPQRYSMMVDWSYTEYSRIRLQYNRDESYEQADDQIFVQYTMSLGSHGAHTF
jgi:hypothetical protein